MALTSTDVNYMIYLYLLESGYAHSAFIFGNETKAKDAPTSPGEFCPSALVDLIQKGILYKELQTRIAANGNPVRDITSSELIRAKHPLDPLKSAVVSPIQAPRRRWTDHTGHIGTQAWHPSEAILATGSADGSSRIYHMSSNVFDQQSCDILQHAVPGNIASSEVAAVAWAPDGDKIATATFDGHMRLWSRNGSMLLCEQGLPPLQGVQFSKSGKYIAAHGGTGGAVVIWDAATGKQVASLHRHNGAVFGLCWGPDEQFATCGQDSLLQISRVRTVATGGSAGSSSQDTTVQWERNINMRAGHVNDVDCCSETGWWAACSDSGTVMVVKSRQEGRADGMEGVEEEGELLIDTSIAAGPVSHEQPVHSCRFSPTIHKPGDPDHILLATSSSAERSHAAHRAKPPAAEACIKVWDCREKNGVVKLRLTWPEATKPVYMYNVQWSPDGRYITCATFKPHVCVWDTRSGEVALHADVKAAVTVASWSSCGNVLAVSMADGTIDLLQWTG
eukprot:jgi/Ulvmu1/10360/UM061_0043.1